jgi:SIT4-associating protein SAP185/190
MKAIITVSANASQNEQACIGPNELTRQLVSRPCVEQLINYMLGGGNPLTVGVGIIIEVIRKNNSDYDPEVGPDSNAVPSSRDPIYLGTLLRQFANRVPDFMDLIMNTNAQKRRIASTFDDDIEPLGFDRFKTCELMAELLHCSNMALLNEVGSEQVIALRDQERQRLRAEGKLIPARAEEAQSSAEDLTMRGRHSSPDDNRRLEVTNASDDDGFEEVAPSGDMTEDTSHEFVKAEDEMPPGPISSFLEKDDDDDFVDEPLSSPRLHVQDTKVDDLPEIENPDMVVAPLSPKKISAKPAASTAEEFKSKEEEATEKESSVVESTGPDPVADANKPSEEPNERTPGSDASLGDKLEAELDSTISDLAADNNVEKTTAAPTDTSDTVQLDRTDTVPGDAKPGTVELEATPATENGEGSIIVGHDVERPATQTSATDTVNPVVGDYLKMQFVEHKVVPTILVTPTTVQSSRRMLTFLVVLLQVPLE